MSQSDNVDLLNKVKISVVDPHNIDADPDSTYQTHGDTDADPDFYLTRIRIFI